MMHVNTETTDTGYVFRLIDGRERGSQKLDRSGDKWVAHSHKIDEPGRGQALLFRALIRKCRELGVKELYFSEYEEVGLHEYWKKRGAKAVATTYRMEI